MNYTTSQGLHFPSCDGNGFWVWQRIAAGNPPECYHLVKDQPVCPQCTETLLHVALTELTAVSVQGCSTDAAQNLKASSDTQRYAATHGSARRRCARPAPPELRDSRREGTSGWRGRPAPPCPSNGGQTGGTMAMSMVPMETQLQSIFEEVVVSVSRMRRGLSGLLGRHPAAGPALSGRVRRSAEPRSAVRKWFLRAAIPPLRGSVRRLRLCGMELGMK